MCRLVFTPYCYCRYGNGTFNFSCSNKKNEEIWAMTPSMIPCPDTVRIINPATIVCEACRSGAYNRSLSATGTSDCNWERFTQRLRDAAWSRVFADHIQNQGREQQNQGREQQDTGEREADDAETAQTQGYRAGVEALPRELQVCYWMKSY